MSAAAEVARLPDLDNAASVPEGRSARHLAHALRQPLLGRVSLSEEFVAPLMAATGYAPDPSFCRGFTEPALYAFGRRRVTAALLEYARTGTDAEQAGTKRALVLCPLAAAYRPVSGIRALWFDIEHTSRMLEQTPG
ncbi:hypothetical protein ACF1BE_29015 [Streptomyces sp. NPDC014991]|uniref:hypothetical protein n=1 Tax=Streptomyces sp. NPDC014991 TaxID=3364935 RepID=UPI003701DCC7